MDHDSRAHANDDRTPTILDPSIDAERLHVLLREIFQAAGGTHDDWDTYDRTIRVTNAGPL